MTAAVELHDGRRDDGAQPGRARRDRGTDAGPARPPARRVRRLPAAIHGRLRARDGRHVAARAGAAPVQRRHAPSLVQAVSLPHNTRHRGIQRRRRRPLGSNGRVRVGRTTVS